MSHFNKDKVWINYQIEELGSLNPRRYTLTHSDEIGEIYLIIDSDYHYEKLTDIRDELLAELKTDNGFDYYFCIYLRVDGVDGIKSASKRNEIFKRELPLALSSIKYGDPYFFTAYPYLIQMPIYVYFQSEDPNFNRVEYYGTFMDY